MCTSHDHRVHLSLCSNLKSKREVPREFNFSRDCCFFVIIAMCVYYISETLDVTHDSLTMTNELDFYLVKQENDVEYTKTRFNRVLLNMTHRWTSFEADS